MNDIESDKKSHLLWLQQQHHEQEVIVRLHCTHSLLPCATEFLRTAEINKTFQNYKAINLKSRFYIFYVFILQKQLELKKLTTTNHILGLHLNLICPLPIKKKFNDFCPIVTSRNMKWRLCHLHL